MWNIIQFTFSEIVCGACWVFPILITLKPDFSDSLSIAIIEKIFSRYIDLSNVNWKAFIAGLLKVSSHFALRALTFHSDGNYKILPSVACGDTNQQVPISLSLYCCSCFWTNESSLLRQLFRPLHLCVPLLLLLKRKVFWCVPFPFSWSWKIEWYSKQKLRIFTKIEWCFSKDISKFVKRQLL